MSEALTTFPGGRGKKATFTGLNLDTLDDTRQSFARVIREYSTGDISENMARTLGYLLSNYLAYWKHADDLRIEARIQAIEGAINETARR